MDIQYQNYSVTANDQNTGILSIPNTSDCCMFFGIPLWNSEAGFIDRLELTVKHTKYVVAKLGTL